MNKLKFFIAIFLTSLCFSLSSQEQVYEFRTYEIGFFKSVDVLHNYFEKALIPALNRQGVEHVGVFKEDDDRLPQKVYLLIPYENIVSFQHSKQKLLDDKIYLADANAYLNATQEEIPYSRISTELIQSSKGFPKLKKPMDDSMLYELRIYESHNEDALRRKVKMFDDSEFAIFEEVGLPMVFFGSNIAGTQMPCLTYLLAFKDKEAHAEAWSKFGPHPEWQRIIKLEEYANSMNEIIRVFLKPVSYSQI